nr:basic proline-rich protein-like [Kogia breviceps]
MTVREAGPGQPGTEPRHPSEGGSGRARHATAWPRARAACPRSAQPGQRGAGAGCGSTPLGSGPLRPRVGSGGAGRAEARLAAERTVATPPPGLGTWRRSPRAQRGGWPSPASGRSALGSPRAAERDGGPPTPFPTPPQRARPPPAAAPRRPPPPPRRPPRNPRPLILRLLGRLAAAAPPRGPPLPLSSAPRPPPRRPPEPGTRNPRRGPQRACAGLFPRTCENARGRGGRLPRTCASARGLPSIFPRGQARPNECPLRPWPALAAAGPTLTSSVEAAPGAPPLRAAR